MKLLENWKMKNRLETEKRILGKRIDLNWLKYKVSRNKKYLVKLNRYIDNLVAVDINLAKIRKPARPPLRT